MKKRLFYLDALRLLSALLVIMIHVSAQYVGDVSDSAFVVGNVFDGLSRVAVPLFVMISGALMLDESKEYSIKDFLKKYVLKLSIITVAWSIVFAVIRGIIIPIIKNEPISLLDLFDRVLNGDYHMWYLYMIIGLYLITPVLKLFVKKDNAKYILYLISVIVLIGIAGNTIYSVENKYVQSVSSLFDKFYLNGFAYLAYYLLGWYLANFEIQRKKRIIIYCLGTLGCAYTILATQIVSTKYQIFIGFYEYVSLNVLLSSVAVFVFLKQMFENKNPIKASKFIAALSKLTFGVYMIHTIIFPVLFKIIPQDVFSVVRIIVIWLITTVISFAATYIATKIPFIKYFVRG